MLAESKAAEPQPGLRAPARTASPRQDCGSAAGPPQLALSSGLLPFWCCATAVYKHTGRSQSTRLHEKPPVPLTLPRAARVAVPTTLHALEPVWKDQGDLGSQGCS